MMIEASLEDFCDIIKALPPSTQISMPRYPKHFIAQGISIIAMAIASFNTFSITHLDAEITSLKGRTYLLMEVLHIHKAHIHHL
jgi:hypothetical protein